ncbi:hypothetical protein TI10_06955 [Photorhabdus luminescens subsp. luminescens]|nr:hypothetical protein TI10_06955 [Photorhabdus luminescens subsp. luminescens]
MPQVFKIASIKGYFPECIRVIGYLSYYPIILLSYYPIILLSYYPIILLSYYPIILTIIYSNIVN